MPQVVDLEALVCGGGDGKIVCETTLVVPASGPKPGEPPVPSPPPDELYQAAESFRLAVEDEIEWLDLNAAPFYDRDDSTKGTTNPKSQQHHNTNPNTSAKLHSSSQRYAAKPKAPIIALPNKLQHSGYLGQSSRRHAANFRIFPKKVGAEPRRGKSAVPESEPTSPKVSCIGRVLSDRDRKRCQKVCRGRTSEAPRELSSGAPTPTVGRQRRGFWPGIFSCCGQGMRSAALDEESASSRTRTATTKVKIAPSAPAWDRTEAGGGDTVLAGPAPGLGGMKRFASGRRPASWGGDGETEEAEQGTKSGPLPRSQPGVGILGRRSVRGLADLDCDRDWEVTGPSSA